jgi:membrane-associated phospholipid phosphatase
MSATDAPPRAPAGSLAAADLAVLRGVRSSARDARTIAAVRGFARLGEHGAIWLALGAAGTALDRGRRGRWRRATVAVAGSYALNTAVKALVARPRPQLEDLPALMSTPTKLSFPSAHATTSFCAARAYSALLPAPPLYALACAMAASRVYLGVHYPSDVLAGAALGSAVGSLAR